MHVGLGIAEKQKPAICADSGLEKRKPRDLMAPGLGCADV
jgi:hypothetical protein